MRDRIHASGVETDDGGNVGIAGNNGEKET